MLKHNLKLFFRNIKRQKSTFLINILGLSSGLVCVLLIALWVVDELKVDKFHENQDRLFQVMLNFENDADISTTDWTPAPLAPALVDELPEVEKSVTVFSPPSSGFLLKDDGSRLRANEVFAGKDFFQIFSFELIEGNKNQLLSDITSVAISESMAQNLFNSTENIIGKSLKWDQEDMSGIYNISGVFKSVPSYSTLQFDIVFSFEHFISQNPEFDSWVYNDPNTFILLRDGSKISEVNKKLEDLIKSKPDVEAVSSLLHKFSKRHLYGTFKNGMQSGGRITYVRLFSVIAIFILLIACINFMNLSTAQASKRIKEIGIKKAVGAFRKSLIFQYLGESLLMTCLSLITAFTIVLLFLPSFNEIIDKQLALNFEADFILMILGITLLTAIVSGSYPALYLSGFKPMTLLSGRFRTKSSESWLRQGLVILQFSASVILITSVIAITEQINLLQSKNLGYDKEHVIVFKKDGEINKNLETFLIEVKNIPGVIDATSSDQELLINGTSTKGLTWEGKAPTDQIAFSYINANYDFIEVLGINVKEGRSFSKRFKTDGQKVILNETAVHAMGLKEPVGKTINIWGEDREIAGIVEDFHFQSLYQEVKPLFLKISDQGNDILVRVQAGTEKNTIARLENFYKEYNDGLTFDYRFLDADYDTFYKSEQRVATLSKYFAGLAILISCLGLFGLATFTAERRRKEISIRKVLGQSASQVVAMLTGEFAKLVMVAIVIALPIAYLLANDWLSSFAYRIPLQAWYFTGAGMVALLVAMLTVGSQALTAANRNPVEGLREE